MLTRWRNRLTQGTSADDAWSASGQQSPPIVLASLLRTLPGRLLLLTSGLLLLTVGLQFFITPPPFIDLFRKVVSLAWLAGVTWIVALAISRNRRAFLWRVRRKLLLSYLFLGVVPVVLSIAFALAFGVLLYVTVTSYVFLEGYGDTVEDLHQIAETSAIELGRSPATASAALQRKFANLAATYPELSLAAVPAVSSEETVTAGPWAHATPPDAVPRWIQVAGGFSGTLPLAATSAGASALVIRSVVPTSDRTRFVVADLPVDAAVIGRLRDRTGTGIEGFAVSGCGATAAPVAQDEAARQTSLFRETVAFVDCTAWLNGEKGRVAVHLVAPVAGLYNRLAEVGAEPVTGTFDFSWSVLVHLLEVLGALFLIVQGSAFVMGAVLAKSITSAVHELFVGTERVQQGDFAHRITIESRDQLGELADSFNRMSASIEHLLHVQREKQRLDDELRIAREIQKSLLPVHPPRIPGLDIAALCEPAREVGGDYYDFFEIGPGVLGVLIADVSGKGTSAALYMAELKGIILALSHTETSPRDLLIQVNQLLADHLDNRSFITMTYAVLDLNAGTLTSARAGHTPLMVVSGGRSEVIMSDGMVLGLRLPGATERFPQLLAEHTRAVVPGDIVVLYTDGITEAMDRTGELFGDAALARVLQGHPELGATAIRERVLREVRAFVGDAEPHDDMTMVVLKLDPAAS